MVMPKYEVRMILDHTYTGIVDSNLTLGSNVMNSPVLSYKASEVL